MSIERKMNAGCMYICVHIEIPLRYVLQHFYIILTYYVGLFINDTHLNNGAKDI